VQLERCMFADVSLGRWSEVQELSARWRRDGRGPDPSTGQWNCWR
jgi:hypothetical protein